MRIPEGTRAADLSALSVPPESGRLNVEAPASLKTLIFPAGVLYASVEPDLRSADEPYALEWLDCSAADGLTQLVLDGAALSAVVPDSLHTLVFYGGDLSGFVRSPSLTELALLHPTDLSPLREASALGSLSLFRAPDDPEWDLSPLVSVPLVVLRLSPDITSAEAAGLAGVRAESLQISDAAVDDLSFLASMPDTKYLLLGTSSDQPPEFYDRPGGPLSADLIPLLNTPIPAAQLLDFAQRGEIYAFDELNR